ncbi:hypothetical protein K443DRAFT_645352 [Laccaria amethystina LaAM-08-1]|uniref:Arrestin-like N-terminal domain-containing protein n=1 Tax=Laccaria amethystina LaAM-08-1 TaxID=1095629 RepID=A0A0C9WIU9_9AGAR|nr:hypothetical protein K443DRAFT_645352 [Laccaria amethystina LaAM-08-1]
MVFFLSRTSLPRSNTLPQTSSAANNNCSEPSRPGGSQPPSYSMVEVSLADSNEEFPPAPPRYSMILQHRRSSDNTQRRLNPTLSPSQTKHGYHISNKNRVWATLTIFSRSSTLTHAFPRFYGNDPVSGTVDLNLDSPQTINSITISLRGRVKTSLSGEGSYTFLDQSIFIWSRHSEDPRHSSAPSGQKFEGKLSGTYSWPFTVPFPKEVAIAGHDEVFPIPQTFFERGVDANVQYELILRVAHGVLRRDSKLQAGIVYIPDITAEPASSLRQRAYLEGNLVPSPADDPLGWVAKPQVLITGSLNCNFVGLECTLFIAHPQCFTPGTVIPCYIRIYTENSVALELLATSDSINVKLVRRVKYYQNPEQAASHYRARAASKQLKESGAFEAVQETARAVWWSPPSLLPEQGCTREMAGEIHLAKDLQPSCSFFPFNVLYAVELHPFDLSSFRVNSKQRSKALVSHSVGIATLHSEGPVPVPFTDSLRVL